MESPRSIDVDHSLHRDLFQGRGLPARMPAAGLPRAAPHVGCAGRRGVAARVHRRDSTHRRATPAKPSIRRRVDAIARTPPHRRGLPRSTTSTSRLGAMLREHLQVPGHGTHRRQPFPRQAGDADAGAHRWAFRVPEFSPVFNDQALDEWTAPRAAAVGAEAAVVGGRDRHQEGRRPRRAAGARSTRRATSGPTACSNSS